MKTRYWLNACVLAVALSVTPGFARVDPHWWGLWTEAQTHRPASLASEARIAPPGEPGTPMVIHGLVLQPDGMTPEAGAIVFAYHTDNTGVYFGHPAQPWRLRGWTRTDAAGQFQFDTIRPAGYPSHVSPAHVHFTIETARYGRQYGGLLFADDPLVTERERSESAAAGRFGEMLIVERDGKTQHVRLNIRLESKGDF
jgi:protocatechuate 3,4-dioxygenase, beta subunit